MRVKTGAAEAKKQQASVDLKKLFEDFSEKYDQVFMESVEDQVFIFRALGRKDFKDLVESKAVNDCAKEEIVCEICTLYPENYDFENCDEAGLPTELCRLILDHSLLKSSDQLQKAIHYFRDKLNDDLDEQITCVIHEAFPEYSVEEIGNWDVVKTADYMTRAEYILHNLRGVPIAPVQPVQKEEENFNDRFQPVKTNPLEDKSMDTPKKKAVKPKMKAENVPKNLRRRSLRQKNTTSSCRRRQMVSLLSIGHMIVLRCMVFLHSRDRASMTVRLRRFRRMVRKTGRMPFLLRSATSSKSLNLENKFNIDWQGKLWLMTSSTKRAMKA